MDGPAHDERYIALTSLLLTLRTSHWRGVITDVLLRLWPNATSNYTARMLPIYPMASVLLGSKTPRCVKKRSLQ